MLKRHGFPTGSAKASVKLPQSIKTSGQEKNNGSAVPARNVKEQRAGSMVESSTELEQSVMEECVSKAKKIAMLEAVLRKCEEDQEKLTTSALDARQKKNEAEAQRCLQQLQRVGNKARLYCQMLDYSRNQLSALENSAAILSFYQDIKGTTEILNRATIDPDELEGALQDSKGAINSVNGVYDALNGDDNIFRTKPTGSDDDSH